MLRCTKALASKFSIQVGQSFCAGDSDNNRTGNAKQ